MEVELDLGQLGKDVARHDEAIRNLTGWQKDQNGAIHRVEAKVDRLIWWIMGTCAVQLLTLLVGLVVFLMTKGVPRL